MAFTLADTTTVGSLTLNHYTEAVTGGILHLVVTSNAVQGATQAPPSLSFAPTVGASLPPAQFSTSSVTTGSLAAGLITGAAFCVWTQTGATPGAQLVRTAAQMLADTPGGYVGLSTHFRIVNTGAGTLTLTTDAGATVTLTGTMTVAQNTWREFILTFNTAVTATIQQVGVGTTS